MSPAADGKDYVCQGGPKPAEATGASSEGSYACEAFKALCATSRKLAG